MARSTDAIQRDIERTRTQLAQTLEELSIRADPKNLADDAKGQAVGVLREPKVQMVLGGVAAGVALLIALSAAGKRKEKKQLKEIQRLLAATR
ncbi:DUF3618 domain-containing protein [Corynebacterium bovis]|uniref:DUF3618 domain-containing protein n=2 Tax=Corynebacterium bovis TaxID=36808 RepID=A0A3R8PP56_9CORY|nr:DUF3618 domain-containing protein [Corynebacterium bovis]MBB3114827.1 hypothetical protein [Corynebacterium bovis DSM 20582 = CIP 54.80]MDH2456172.1 DUF3618 domain-containing protein [Corynebacterium bovis]MDK8511453.1 DUF3618 domain-containing protein [Corynebacterium bovis]MDN8579565.1 DUF3618 domain-containing protein [Corynebacterium bovis]QQC48160.1 DUF3618 domain-containing protein [Corynebacterium bovis]